MHVGVTDVGAGAKTTMGDDRGRSARRPVVESARRVGRHRPLPVFGRRIRQPHHDRDRLRGGRSRPQDLQKQIAEKGMPTGNVVLTASATPNPTSDGKIRNVFGAHFVEVEVDTELGRVRVLELPRRVHDCGRIINPLTAMSQIHGGAVMGIGMALHEDLLYDRRSGVPLTAGYYGARVMTHLDTPQIDVIFVEIGRRLRPVWREEHRRGEQGAGGRRGGQRRVQRDRTAHQGSADHARQSFGVQSP